MSLNPVDLLGERHRPYRQAQERYRRATAAREAAHQRVSELESELAAAESRDRVALGGALVDGHRPGKPEAAGVRDRLEDAKRDAEALSYAEQRRGGELDRLPREHKEDWLSAASRSLGKAPDAYVAAITELARARDQLSDEAVLVTFLRYDGQAADPIGGAVEHVTQNGTVQTIAFAQLTELMLAEAAGVEEKAGLDPNRPRPEMAMHLIRRG